MALQELYGEPGEHIPASVPASSLGQTGDWWVVDSGFLGVSSAVGSGVSLTLLIYVGIAFKFVSVSKSKHRLIILEKSLPKCV